MQSEFNNVDVKYITSVLGRRGMLPLLLEDAALILRILSGPARPECVPRPRNKNFASVLIFSAKRNATRGIRGILYGKRTYFFKKRVKEKGRSGEGIKRRRNGVRGAQAPRCYGDGHAPGPVGGSLSLSLSALSISVAPARILRVFFCHLSLARSALSPFCAPPRGCKVVIFEKVCAGERPRGSYTRARPWVKSMGSRETLVDSSCRYFVRTIPLCYLPPLITRI